MQFGQTTLPMLVALVAVLSAAIPQISRIWFKSKSNIIITDIKTFSDFVSATVSNTGRRAGLIDDIIFEITISSGDSAPYLHSTYFKPADNTIIESKDVKRINFEQLKLDEDELHSKFHEISQYYFECNYKVRIVEPGGAVIEKLFPVDCRSSAFWLYPDFNDHFKS